MEDANERGRKKDGHMRVFNAHEPRLGSCASCETSTRIDSVHKCVQARRNAADLYKQSDPHCRTCMQRGIFARFFVLTVSACLLALPLCPSVPLFPIYSISNSYDSTGIIGEITFLFIYIFVNLLCQKLIRMEEETMLNGFNKIKSNIVVEFFIKLVRRRILASCL